MFKQINFYSGYIIIQSISFTIINLQHFFTITLFIIICNILRWHLLNEKKLTLCTKNKITNLLSFFAKCDFYLFLKRLFWKFHTLLSLSTLCLLFYFFICCCISCRIGYCIGCCIGRCNWFFLYFWLWRWRFCLFFFTWCWWFT